MNLRFKDIASKGISKLFYFLIANLFLLYLVISKRKSTYVLIIDYPLGDTCYGLCFSDYLINKYKCKFYICEKQKSLVEQCYPHIDHKNVIYYKKQSFFCNLINYINFRPYVNRLYGRHNVFATIPYAYYNPTDIIIEGYVEYLRGVLNIDKNVPICLPAVSGFNEGIKQKEKLAVLNPYSFSMEIDNLEYWEKLVSILQDKNYKVFTNAIGKQKTLDGTKRLDCSIFDLYKFTDNKNVLVFSIRSGILDFMIGNKSGFFVIYYGDNNSAYYRSLRNFCNLNRWGAKEVLEIEGKDQYLLEKTKEFIENHSKNNS